MKAYATRTEPMFKPVTVILELSTPEEVRAAILIGRYHRTMTSMLSREERLKAAGLRGYGLTGINTPVEEVQRLLTALADAVKEAA